MTFEVLKALDGGIGSTLEDYKFLYGFVSLVKPKRVLDIGTNYGLSAIVMAMALRDCNLEESMVFTVDISESCQEVARKQIGKVGLSKYIKVIYGTSSDIGGFFDVVFIDGNHSFSGCMKDFNNVANRATYILIHDSTQLHKVSETVKEIRKKGHSVLNIDIGQRGEAWSHGKVVYRSYPGIAIVKVKQDD